MSNELIKKADRIIHWCNSMKLAAQNPYITEAGLAPITAFIDELHTTLENLLTLKAASDLAQQDSQL